ncbi:hypothetical protein SAMN05216604_114125 [Pseudomonas agarici]|nr:hypothetical protein SAMN05216604_114125 [Pseudomonas agarici]
MAGGDIASEQFYVGLEDIARVGVNGRSFCRMRDRVNQYSSPDLAARNTADALLLTPSFLMIVLM